MTQYRTGAVIQHAMIYPSAHLDRFANFGPAFEMPDAPNGPAPATSTAPQQTQPTAPAGADTTADTAPQFNARRFITGGSAIFTLQGKQARYTYRVTRSDDGKVYFVAYLTGSDNVADYTYIGLLDVARGAVRLTRKSSLTEASTPYVALNWALRWIWAGKELPAPARIYHVGRCGRCGRALTVPSSIESGFGPECLGKLGE